MKICKIIIKGFQQFQDTTLDFTDPKTGRPLNKICLIGQNGTGKSTILQLLDRFLAHEQGPQDAYGFVVVQLLTSIGLVYRLIFRRLGSFGEVNIFLSADIDQKHPDWLEKYQEHISKLDLKKHPNPDQYPFALFQKEAPYAPFYISGPTLKQIKGEFGSSAANPGLQIYSPAEAHQNTYAAVANLPNTTLNEALPLMSEFPVRHEVSNETVVNMWNTLVCLVKQRESEQQAFEIQDENIDLTKRELLEKFNSENPDILEALGTIWNRILERANLELDIEGAKKPVQLTENLEAYIRLKRNGKERIPYNRLSKGIRDFLFRIGHIFLLFYRREIKQAFLMVDEPENSLFPDFLFDLMELYQEIANPADAPDRTQMFFATHNPIVAAQFEPQERIILEWQDDGYVTAHKGKSPAGDDPNDVLRRDFELPHLMGSAGQQKWQEYLDLKKRARREPDSDKKSELVNQALKIGDAYNFPGESQRT